MSYQGRVDRQNFPFFLSGSTSCRENETILQIGGRGTTALLSNTLMAQVAASGKWVPYTDVTATDGTCTARGIYVGDDIAGASLVAGDVTGCPIVVLGVGATFDSSQLTIENAVTLATVIGAGSISCHTVRDDLARIGMYSEDVIDIDGLEN